MFVKTEQFLPETNSPITHPAVSALDKLIQFSLFTFVAFSMFSITVTQIAFSIGSISWLWKVHLTQTWKEVIGTRVGIAIFCFCLACLVAVGTSVDLENSFIHLKKLLQFIVFFWVINTVQNEKQRDLLIGTLIVAGVVAAMYGLSPYWQADLLEVGRIHGTRSTVATFAGILMLTGLTTLGWFLFHEPRKYWVLGCAGIIGICLLLTLSRHAWLGFFIGVAFLLFFWNKKYLLIIPFLIVCLLYFAPANIKDRMHTFGNIGENSFQSRVILWQGGWEIFKDYPITGCGFKCVDTIHTEYPDPRGYLAFYRGMHNNIIQLLVDTGIIGLGFWISIWVAFFIEIFKRWRGLAKETFQDNAKGILMGSLAPVIGLLGAGFFETNFYDSEMVMLLFFFMGISLANVKKAPMTEKITSSEVSFIQVNQFIPPLDKVIKFSLFTFVVFSMFSITITQLSFAIGVLAWLVKVHLTKSWIEIRGTPIGLPILCFCLASVLAVITSVDLATSLQPLKKLLQFAVFFWVANTVEDERQKDSLIKLLIAAGVIASLLGFSQAWTNAVSLDTRVSGTMSIYMTFAGLLMLVGLFALGRALFNEAKEIWVISAVGVITICLLLTLTRQAWLGFLVGIIILTIFWNKKYLLALPVIMVGLILFSPESVKARLFSLIDLKDWTLQARFFLWKGGWEIFKDYPITGCGFKCVDFLHLQYPDPSGYISRLRGMHSNILQLLVDIGIIGFGAWLSIWVVYLLTLYKKWAQLANDNTKGLVMGSAAAVIGFLAGGLFETNFYDSEVIMLLYFIMGISLAQTNKKVSE